MYILWFIFLFLYIQCARFGAVSVNAPFTVSREEVFWVLQFSDMVGFPTHRMIFISSGNFNPS